MFGHFRGFVLDNSAPFGHASVGIHADRCEYYLTGDFGVILEILPPGPFGYSLDEDSGAAKVFPKVFVAVVSGVCVFVEHALIVVFSAFVVSSSSLLFTLFGIRVGVWCGG